jgi:hypothetical protein
MNCSEYLWKILSAFYIFLTSLKPSFSFTRLSNEYDALNERQMELFRDFRSHGGTDISNAYRVMNEELTELCEKWKPESFKQFFSTLNCHLRLREMYDMARRCRWHVSDFSCFPEFAEKMAPPFVTLLRLVEACLHHLCWILQYADDLYISGNLLRLLRTARRCLWQDWWLGLGIWIFHCLKTSQKWWFFRKHENLQVSVRFVQTALQFVTKFKYLRIIFDRKLTSRLHG